MDRQSTDILTREKIALLKKQLNTMQQLAMSDDIQKAKDIGIILFSIDKQPDADLTPQQINILTGVMIELFGDKK